MIQYSLMFFKKNLTYNGLKNIIDTNINQTVEAGVKTGNALTESRRWWESGSKQLVKWAAEGAAKARRHCCCGMFAWVYCDVGCASVIRDMSVSCRECGISRKSGWYRGFLYIRPVPDKLALAICQGRVFCITGRQIAGDVMPGSSE